MTNMSTVGHLRKWNKIMINEEEHVEKECEQSKT